MGNQHNGGNIGAMGALHSGVTAGYDFIPHGTSYPGPYNVNVNSCDLSTVLENVHDSKPYYHTQTSCSFVKLTDAKAYCAAKPSCNGVTQSITNPEVWIPVSGIPTLGGKTMNGTSNTFYHKVKTT